MILFEWLFKVFQLIIIWKKQTKAAGFESIDFKVVYQIGSIRVFLVCHLRAFISSHTHTHIYIHVSIPRKSLSKKRTAFMHFLGNIKPFYNRYNKQRKYVRWNNLAKDRFLIFLSIKFKKKKLLLFNCLIFISKIQYLFTTSNNKLSLTIHCQL